MPPKGNSAAVGSTGNVSSSGSSSSNPGVVVDLTIERLIKSIPPGYPSTELISKFLQLIGSNIQPIPRDVNTLGLVFSRARLVYDYILELIKQIDASNAEDPDPNWESFDRYTIAIPLLERFLFSFFEGYAIGKSQGHLPPADTTENGVLHITIWRTNREVLKKSLIDLTQRPFQVLSPEAEKKLTASSATERTKDDSTTLHALREFIFKSTLSDKDVEHGTVPETVKTLKSDAVQMAQKMLRTPPADTQIGIALRALMYIYIPFALIPSPTTDGNWKTYLRKAAIWEGMNKMMEKVKSYVEGQTSGQAALDDLEKVFLEIEKLLLNLGDTQILTSKEMMSLFRLAASIHRQYHGRSVALVKTLYHLDQHSRKPESAKVSSYRYDLKQVMTESVDTLTQIKSIVLDLKGFTIDSRNRKDFD